jgi:putative membrane protein
LHRHPATNKDEELYMRSTNSLIAALTAGLALGAAAQTRPTTPQSGNIVTAEAPGGAAANKSADDIEFLVDALRTAMAEIEMGKLAAQRGQDARVREYGAKIDTDHTAHVAEIERLLKPLSVTIPAEPSADAQLQHATLARLSGQDFDAAFVEAMIGSHTEAIEAYGAQTHANPDRALADLASMSLPMLREHLRIAESLR